MEEEEMILYVEIAPPILLRPMFYPHKELERHIIPEPISFTPIAEGSLPMSNAINIGTVDVEWRLWMEIRWKTLTTIEETANNFETHRGRWYILQWFKPDLKFETKRKTSAKIQTPEPMWIKRDY